MKTIGVVLISVSMLAGCESAGPKESVGALLGATAGGILGSQIGSGKGQIAATVIGVLAGGALGKSIGRSLDTVDRAEQRRTTGAALETARTGTSLPWHNPESGNSGAVTPTRTYQRADGTYCREFTQTVTIGGQTEHAYGTACRQPDGTWKIVG